MSEARFVEKVSLDEAKEYVKQGRKPYQYLTADPSALPIFGPGYDEHGSLNIARKEDRLARSVDEALRIAKRMSTQVSEVFFLTTSR